MKNSITRLCQKLRNTMIAGLLAIATIGISGCAELAIATVAIATVDVIHDRRTVGEYIDDSAIEVTLKKYLVEDKQRRSEAHVNGTSWNGILLLTGEVQSEARKQEIVSFANNRIQGVRQVVDETRVSGKTGLLSRASDSWITAKVKTNLATKMGADANRIKVVTEYGNVYLMGIVTQEEATRATDITRSIRGVVRVVRVFEYTA